MLWNLLSSRTGDLSPEETLELVNKHLELARKEDDSVKASELANKAKLLLKDAKNIFVSKKVKDPALTEGIANAYHEHGKLLEDLGYHDKAKKSHSKAKKWGYVDVVGRDTGSLHLLGKSNTIHRLLLPAAALSVAPGVVAATHQDSSKTDVTQLNHQGYILHPTPAEVNSRKPTPNKDGIQIQRKVFDQDVAPPFAKYALPKPNERITSTPQLAYCLSLLHPSMLSKEDLDQSEHDWLQDGAIGPDERSRLQTMATNLIRAFVREDLKKSGAVAEVVSLTAVLEQEDFRKLLQEFVDGINQSMLLDTSLLNGLAQLIRNAPQGYIEADDLVKILGLLNTRLKDTHKQSTKHIYQLALTISQILDSMVDSQVKGLSREQLHEPLSDYLEELKQDSDPYLIYQAAYAYQALQYIPDDETILQFMMRRTGKIVQGISGVVSAVKALDLVGFIEGLQNLQQGLAGAEKAIGLVSDACSNVAALAKNGQELLVSLKEGFNFKHKSSWYPALRGLDRLVQEGRLIDFEKLVREAPCQHNPAFRLGVYQRLGEIAANSVWDLKARKCAVEFLVQLYKDDANNGQQDSTKQWIVYILSQLAESSNDIIEGSTRELLQEAQPSSSCFKGTMHRGCESDIPVLHSIMVVPPSVESPLLDCVQSKIDVETPLRRLRLERLKGRDEDVYISPRAKASRRATDHFDLAIKVQEFLASDRKVFLILGDSGAGKSTFNKSLEINLWDNYKTNGRIPLFIHLPEIEKPERDLIAEKLRKANFTESQILELKLHREFILICDGYDESQQTKNLYMSNHLNQSGQWRAQMVISCRSEYNGVEYKHHFEPSDRNSNKKAGLFQEAIISPFNKDQIQSYVEQYVSLTKPPWKCEDYHQAIKKTSNLQHLVKNPFLLKISLEVLPWILGKNNNYSTTRTTRITRLELYDEFIAQWIERGKKRFTEMELSSSDKLIFKQLSDSGFQQRGITYLKGLVTAIYEHQDGNPVIDCSEQDDRASWKGAFFGSRDGSHFLREAIPLTRNGNQYWLIHKSFLEYGLSLAIFGPSKRDEDTGAMPSVSRRGSTSSVLSFENPSPTENTTTADDQSLLDSPLGKRNLVGERSVMQFLTERVQQEPVFKDQLRSVIERSKSDKMARTAAANAITILVRAGVPFISSDLRNIKIPGADLSFGMFDSAQLEGADLRKVNLRNVWMRQANLRGAQMKGVQFGELPFIQDDIVVCSAYSPVREIYAAGLDNASISLYETSSWNRIKRLEGHNSVVNSISFSPASDKIASGSRDFTVRLWNVDTGECVHTLHGHSDIVSSVVYSPKGDKIASGSWDSTVRLWDVDTGECVHTLHGHSDIVSSVVYSPKGDKIASGSWDSTVRLWDVDTGECVHTLQGRSDEVNRVVYSPKGDQIASGSDDKTVQLWDVDTGECVHTLQGHSDIVSSVVYSPKGDKIASGSWDYTVRLWDVDTGECVHTLQGHSDMVSSVVYSPKGDRIASGSWDYTVRLWDVDTGECVHTLQGHSSIVDNIVYSQKGDRIASGSRDSTVRLWDVDASECVHTFQGHSDRVSSVVYSPKGDRIASGGRDNTVRLWDVDTGECVHTLEGHSDTINTVVYSPKGDRIASGSMDDTVRLWDVDTLECIHTLWGHSGIISSIAYSPKGDRIASGSMDCTVRLWDVDTGECVHILQGHSSAVWSVVYSPKGDRIAFKNSDKAVRLWDVDTGECVNALEGHNDAVSSIVYSPKGDRIASCSADETARLWDVDTGECIHILRGHSGIISSVAYSPNGDQIASGSRDSTVRLWDVDTGECVHILQGHSGAVWRVVYSPRGDWIASRGDDETVKLWDVETGQCQATISGFGRDVSSIAFEVGADALYLVTGSWDKSVRRWQVTKGEAGYKAVLCWSSSHEVLTVHDLSFEDVQGLSHLNQKLLIQRGALTPTRSVL